MICAVIRGPALQEAENQIRNSLPFAQFFEMRLDLLAAIDVHWLHSLQIKHGLRMIFTLRKLSEGGNFSKSEEERHRLIRELIPLQPEFFDIETDTSPAFIQELMTHGCSLLISSHFFHSVPENIEEHYLRMKQIPAKLYKIAIQTNSTTETLQFLSWAKRQEKPLVSVAMGPHGQISRILSPICQSPITYATPDAWVENALGQLSVHELHENYRHPSLSKHTKVFGLIGDPVKYSPSHITHNQAFHRLQVDAVYVKMQVTCQKLPDFLALAKVFPFSGLSVTMPLKEVIIPYVDNIDPEARKIGAVNTLAIKEGMLYGYNTDGKGALEVLEKKMLVSQKKMVILGAGGAARAIAYEAIKRGCDVVLLSRNSRQAEKVAEEFGCRGDGIDQMEKYAKEKYHFLINCTPSEMPIDVSQIVDESVVMDVSLSSQETAFLQMAKSKRCQVIYGIEMFFAQARRQFALWLFN